MGRQAMVLNHRRIKEMGKFARTVVRTKVSISHEGV